MREEEKLLRTEMETNFQFTRDAIDRYLQDKLQQGVSSVTAEKYKTSLCRLCDWLGEDKGISAARLQAWRKDLEDHGYSKITVQSYVKVTNDFLRSVGHRELCIPKPMRNDLTGQTFGYLTVLEATDKRKRKDIVWHCLCKCGKEVEIPTAMLLGGHTTSCGCLNVEILKHTNRYVEGTSLRQCLDERIVNPKSASGYVGVQPKRDKWMAYINYKGVRYNLGTYGNLEDAIAARAKGKEWVMEEAARLYEEYSGQYGEMPGRPPKPEKQTVPEPEPVKIRAKRSNNTSGTPGVTMKYGKWSASICVKGYRYWLGVYERLEDAVAVRGRAEELVKSGDTDSLRAMSTNRPGT